jgi:long-chain acyl-CoA synthetase
MLPIQFLFDLPAYQHKHFPQKIAVGHWRQQIEETLSSEQLMLQVEHTALRLIDMGIQRSDRIILVTDKFSAEWLIADMAIMMCGAIAVPLHYPQRIEDTQLILSRIEPALCIRSAQLDARYFPKQANEIILETLVDIKRQLNPVPIDTLIELRKQISEHDMATIVHTSGSSGEPRAVCLSHFNLLSNVMATLSLVPFETGTRVMSFLPLSHIFERMVCYVYLASGANIYFIDTYRHAVFALPVVKPEYFTCVPMVLERFANALESRVEEMNWLIRWAYRSWEKSNRGAVSHLGSLVAHQLIIKRWRRKFGGQLKGIISGAAYLDPKVEMIYARSGIRIRQGYGMTEASPGITINRFDPGGHKRGTVGLPLPGVHVRIAGDGEILVQGPNVMLGYYRDQVATDEVIRDGWLHTGDIGHLDRDGFLILTGRNSSIYKHASGKFISPAHIEARLTQHPLIHHALIIGYKRPFTIALIVPHFDTLKEYCVKSDIHWTAPEYMIHNTKVIEHYRYVLDHLGLHTHEHIEKFILVADEWKQENGLLTATMKPRRGEIERKYEKAIEELYA